MSVITEVDCVAGVMPDDFIYFVENWLQCVKEFNPLMKEVFELEPVCGIKVSKTIANAPWPLANRVTFAARYPCVNFKPGEHLLMISQKGSEPRIHLTEQEKKDLAVAQLFIAGWQFSTVEDSCGDAVGTRICYL